MPGGPAVRGDRLRPRRDQRRDLLQRPAQRARRHVEPVGGQRLDDPVHRPAQHMLLIRQPRQEPGGEQALRHRPGRRRRADRPGPRMRTPPPVAAPPPHDPGDLHLPVDLLAVLGAQELKRLPALRAAPLAGIHIDDTVPQSPDANDPAARDQAGPAAAPAYPRRRADRRQPGRSPVRASRPSPTTSRTATRSASSRSPAAWPPARPARPPARSARPYPPATRRSRPPAPRPAPRPARHGHASNRHQHPHRSPARETHDPAHTATTATSRIKPGVSRPRRAPPHGITDYLRPACCPSVVTSK